MSYGSLNFKAYVYCPLQSKFFCEIDKSEVRHQKTKQRTNYKEFYQTLAKPKWLQKHQRKGKIIRIGLKALTGHQGRAWNTDFAAINLPIGLRSKQPHSQQMIQDCPEARPKNKKRRIISIEKNREKIM